MKLSQLLGRSLPKKPTAFNSRQFAKSLFGLGSPTASTFKTQRNLESLGLDYFCDPIWAWAPSERRPDSNFVRARILQPHLTFLSKTHTHSSTPEGKQPTRLLLRIIAMSYYPGQGFSGAAPHQNGYPPQSYSPAPGYPPQQGYGPPGPAYGGGYGRPPPQQAPYGYNVGITSSQRRRY